MCIFALILAAIFVILYGSFLFSGKLYAYQDIGADTVKQYLPIISMEIDMIQSGTDGIYNLQYGLGDYCDGFLFKYMNPVNWAVLLFGQANLPVALLVAMLFEYLIIVFFSFQFFSHLLKNREAAAISSLLWTFSGFVVLWGQHYAFHTSMAAFTVAMFGFQLFLEGHQRWWLVVPCIAYLAATNYYFFYISCYFFLVYGITFLLLKKNSWKMILKKIGIFMIPMLMSVGMAASSLLPNVTVFLNSPRTQSITSGLPSQAIAYDFSTILAFAARFLSNNLLGIGDEFQGPTNYYECAILSVSLLSVFALVYLLQSRYKKVTGVMLFLSIVALCTPSTSYLLTFATDRQRWTYILCFGQAIAIGVAITDIQIHTKDGVFYKQLLQIVAIADVLIFGLLFLIYCWYGKAVYGKAYITIALILLLYHIGFLFLFKIRNAYWVVLLLISAELILANYPTINERLIPTVEQWEQEMYQDGSEEVVQWIRDRDDSVYRIAKTYMSVSHNDSMMQNYNGVGIYVSTNSRYLVDLIHSYGYQNSEKWIWLEGDDLLSNEMLGVKYVISPPGKKMDPDIYEQIYDDGTFIVYENRLWLGFGYLYERKISHSTFESKEKQEKLLLLSEGFYTDTDSVVERYPSVSDITAIETMDLLPYIRDSANCEMSGKQPVCVTGTAEDMQINIVLPEIPKEKSIYGILVKMTAQKGSMLQIFAATEDSGYSEQNSSVLYYGPGTVYDILECPIGSAVCSIRLDPATNVQNLTIERIDLLMMDKSVLYGNLLALQENRIDQIVQNGNLFTAEVSCPYKSAMLCIPLIYSECWEASVDGVPAEVSNINGGLVGIEIPQGDHEVVLEYVSHIHVLSKWISGITIGLYVFVMISFGIHKRRGLYSVDM